MLRNGLLKKRMIIVFCVAVLLPILTASSIIAVYFNNVLVAEREKTLNIALNAAMDNIVIYLDELIRTTAIPLSYSGLMSSFDFMNEHSFDNSYGLAQYMRMRNYELDAMRLLYSCRKGTVGMAFYPFSDLRRAYYVSAKSGDQGVTGNLPVTDQRWFSTVLEQQGRGVVISTETSVFEKDNPQIISAARLILDKDTLLPLGVLKVDAYAATLEEMFKSLDARGNSEIALVDSQKRVIYSTTAKIRHEMIRQAMDGDKVIKGVGDTYEARIYPVGDYGWTLLYYDSRSDIMKKTLPVVYFACTICLVCVLLALAVYRKYTGEIIRRVNGILDVMQRVETGDLSARVDIAGDDEFSLIGKKFNQTAERLDKHIKSEYVAQLSRKNAEYLALRSQINPHFLYNTLACFIGLNRIGEKKQLERSIIQLTNLLRYTCKNDDAVTVQEEADFLKNYLLLMKIRYEERLEFEINIEDEAKECALPKLILQPLVENAIVHGLEPYEFNVFITVNARAENGRLTLEILDTGGGFDVSELKNSKRVGISNVRERLKLFYGDAEFCINSEISKGTRCVINIPACGVKL